MDVQASEGWEDVFPFLACPLLFIVIFVHCRHVLNPCGLAQVKRWLVTLRTGYLTGGMVKEEVREIVEDKVLQQTLEHFRQVSRLFSNMFVLVVALLLFEEESSDMAQGILLLLSLALSTIPLLAPTLLTARTFDFFYGMHMLFCCLMVTPLTCRTQMMPALMRCNIMVILLTQVRRTLCHRGTSMLLVCNLAYTATTFATIMTNPQQARASVGLMQICLVFVATIFAFQLEDGVLEMMTQSVQLQETQEMYAAACALLHSCCDIVVELNDEGIILSPAVDLGSYLLRSGQSLQGFCLADLISDDADRSQFVKRLHAPRPKDVGLAESLPVRTRDGNNHVLSLELLWFQFRRTDSSTVTQVHYMVGIREFSDGPARPNRPTQTTTEQGHYWDDYTSTANSQSLPETSSTSLAVDPAIAVVDGTRPGLPIQIVSPGFGTQIGCLPTGTQLCPLLQDEGFPSWMQDSMNRLLNGMRARQRQVVLKMPQGRMRASCRVMEVGSGGEDFALDSVHLQFSSVSRCHDAEECSEHAATPSKGLVSI